VFFDARRDFRSALTSPNFEGMLAELWHRLWRRYGSQRSRRGFQLLPSTVSEFEFADLDHNLSPKVRTKDLPRFYSHYDGFENAVKEEVSFWILMGRMSF
jgi:hypothetical protein